MEQPEKFEKAIVVGFRLVTVLLKTNKLCHIQIIFLFLSLVLVFMAVMGTVVYLAFGADAPLLASQGVELVLHRGHRKGVAPRVHGGDRRPGVASAGRRPPPS